MRQSNLEIMRKTKRIKFDFFDVIKCPTNKYYLSVDKFGHEIIRGKSFEEIANVIGCTAIAIETTLRSERIIS